MKIRQANKIIATVSGRTYTWKQMHSAVKTRYRYLHLPKEKGYNAGSRAESSVRILTDTFYRLQDDPS